MLAPLLLWRLSLVRQLVANADRVGAQIDVVDGDAAIDELKVAGERHHAHKPQSGGWSQKRYQKRAEHIWDANAAGVADESWHW
jgi:hypothetical protein